MSISSRAEALLDKLAEERIRSRKITRAVGLGVLVLFLMFGFTLYRKVVTFDADALILHMQRQAGTQVWPHVSREIDALSRQAVPALTDALNDEMENLLPSINETLVEESVALQEHLDQAMKVSLSNHFRTAINENEDALKDRMAMFSMEGEFYDDLMESMQNRAQGWAQDQLDATFSRRVEVLQEINEPTQALREDADAQRTAGVEASLDDVVMLFMEILNTRLDGEG